MKRLLLFNILIISYSILYSPSIVSQDTFSIVAVDTITGEIGSAGATCLGGGVGAFIISDVIEAIGAIHTQSYWVQANQQYAHALMLLGLSPRQIIDSLVENDVQNNPTIRQYGIVDLTRDGESAAYTGINCFDYKGHITGKGYAIQGNILLGEIIIDTMKTIFLGTEGPLADRLMKTLEAAKIIGADTRCAPRGTSSQSAFVKVVRIGDSGVPYLQEIVPNSPIGVDPIDILRGQFDQWKISLFHTVDPFLSVVTTVGDTLPANGSSQAVINIIPKNNSDTLLASGMEVILSNTGSGTLSEVTDMGDGTYFATLTAPLLIGADTISAMTISNSDTVFLYQKPVIVYTMTTGVQGTITGINDKYHLYQNYPQPFNPSTTIKYNIPERGFVSIKVYDVLGKMISVLVNEEKTPGSYQVEFSARGRSGGDAWDLSSGIYFYTLEVVNRELGMPGRQTGSGQVFLETKKMILLK
jgi:uncharacterized Ntn-hydrolase superfamily protein